MKELPEILLNFWNFLFIGLSFIGIFFSIKLITARLNDRASKALGFYLLLQSLGLLESCLFWTNYFYRVPEFYGSTSLFALLYGPLLLIYFDSVFENPKPLINYGFHFLPFLIMLGLKMPFYLSSGEIKILHPEQPALSYIINGYIDYAEIVKITHLSIYGYVLLRQIRSYPSIGYMRPWANWILVFFISFIVLTILYWSIVVTLGYILLADYFISLSACGSIILLAWLGDSYEKLKEGEPIVDSLLPHLKQQTQQSGQPLSAGSHPDENFSSEGGDIKYKNSGLPASLAKKLAGELELLMSREQLYKENNLKLETLAEKLKSNRHFVSQVINQFYKTNFFDFINARRIDEAKRLLVSGSHEMNIIEIAYAVGYNNKVTFNTVFKRITGVTPTEYRKTNHPGFKSEN
ncbi:MAG: AraC family transcriptional regulator [Bacteroidetes bacterium]|nr:AraC family transcriptional regulator [Bacteroidota bacterium]MBI3482595.1 AraC family transcriptional regulator [Bacteroidota bacterium]